MLFVVVALSYLVCVILILLIPTNAFREKHVRHHERAGTHVDVGNAFGTLWHDMAEGWRIVRADRLLFYSVVQLSVVGIIMLLIGELAGNFVQVVLHRPASQMAFILTPAAVGLVGASALMPRITERVGKVHLTIIGFIVLAIGFFALMASSWIASWLDPKHGSSSSLLFWSIIVIVLIFAIAMASVNIPISLFAGAIAQLIGFDQIVICISVGILLFNCWGVWYVRKASNESGIPVEEDT